MIETYHIECFIDEKLFTAYDISSKFPPYSYAIFCCHCGKIWANFKVYSEGGQLLAYTKPEIKDCKNELSLINPWISIPYLNLDQMDEKLLRREFDLIMEALHD